MSKKEILMFCLSSLAELSLHTLRQENQIGAIMTQINELAGKLQALTEQTNKSIGEVRAKVQSLQDALANAENAVLPLEVQQALDNLIAKVQELDDENPDAVIEPTPEPEVPAEPVEEVPAEEAPVEPAPVEEVPAEEAPVENAEIQPAE